MLSLIRKIIPGDVDPTNRVAVAWHLGMPVALTIASFALLGMVVLDLHR